MRVVKPQPVLANFSPTQWGHQAQMCIGIGVGFRLSDTRVLVHEASVWEALRVTPTVAPLNETGMPKQFAEWVLAGQTQCAFSNAELGLLRDWTAQVTLHKTVKKISAQNKVTQNVHGDVLGCLSVDHTQSTQGMNAQNPVGHLGTSPPLQVLAWNGPQSEVFAGMTPIDVRWPIRRQWMPQFANTLEGMAKDGSHMGWPKHTDRRYFQQAAPDQWSVDEAWPVGATYELRGFGSNGRGYAGALPKVTPEVIVVNGGTTQTVDLIQQTVWFLPDYDMGVLWWSGAVNLIHPLDDSLSKMVVALRDVGYVPDVSALIALASRRTNVKVPDLLAQSDLPLLPKLDNGWAWEQILNADQHPRDRQVIQTYKELREQIFEEENQRAQIHSQTLSQSQRIPLKEFSTTPQNSLEANNEFIWKSKLQLANKQLTDEIFSHQNFQEYDWTGWTLKNVRFESCVMRDNKFLDCTFENIEFNDTSFENVDWCNITWSKGELERCRAVNTKWENVSLDYVHMDQCVFNTHQVISSKWRNVLMNDAELFSSSWYRLTTENLAVIKGKMRGLQVCECKHHKFSVIETDIRDSKWTQSLLINAVFAEDSNLSFSFWQDCDCTSTSWIGLLAHDVRIEHCKFTNLNAQSALMNRSIWLFSSLNDAQFLNANLSDASFDRTSLRGALMSGAQLQGSRITNSNLIRINTSNATHPIAGMWRNNLESGAVMHPQR